MMNFSFQSKLCLLLCPLVFEFVPMVITSLKWFCSNSFAVAISDLNCHSVAVQEQQYSGGVLWPAHSFNENTSTKMHGAIGSIFSAEKVTLVVTPKWFVNASPSPRAICCCKAQWLLSEQAPWAPEEGYKSTHSHFTCSWKECLLHMLIHSQVNLSCVLDKFYIRYFLWIQVLIACTVMLQIYMDQSQD